MDNRVQGFPFDLNFAHLASTMEKWALKFGLDLTSRTEARTVNTLDDSFSTEEEDDVHVIGGNKEVCNDCDKLGHTSETCDVNIDFVLAQKNMANKPHVAKSIEATQTKYIRHPALARLPNNTHFKQRGRKAGGVQSGGRKG